MQIGRTVENKKPRPMRSKGGEKHIALRGAGDFAP